MGKGFSVRPGTLAAGSQQVSDLVDRCGTIASDAVQALAAMEGSAGHQPLASALGGAAGTSTRSFLDIGAVYQHVSQSLSASAGTYTSTEQGLISKSQGIARNLP